MSVGDILSHGFSLVGMYSVEVVVLRAHIQEVGFWCVHDFCSIRVWATIGNRQQVVRCQN